MILFELGTTTFGRGGWSFEVFETEDMTSWNGKKEGQVDHVTVTLVLWVALGRLLGRRIGVE